MDNIQYISWLGNFIYGYPLHHLLENLLDKYSKLEHIDTLPWLTLEDE